MIPQHHRSPLLTELNELARDLARRPGQKFVADQIEQAVVLTDSLALAAGSRVLVVNPSLGNPWLVLACQLHGCQVTLLGGNKSLMTQIGAEYHDLLQAEGPSPLTDSLRTAATLGSVTLRSGQLSLFFPEEDSFDVICLLSISKADWGFGPETLLHHSLRGLREDGFLLTGFLGTTYTDPELIMEVAAEGDFDLDHVSGGRFRYDAYTPEALLFTLVDKTGRCVRFQTFTRIAAGLTATGRINLGHKIESAVDTARRLDIRKGSDILVVGPSPDYWSERVLAGVAGQIDLVLTGHEDLDEARSEFSFFPGIAAVEGGLQLQTALRNPNNRFYSLDPTTSPWADRWFDCIYMTQPDNGLTLFHSVLPRLNPGGSIVLGYYAAGQCDLDVTIAAAAERGLEIVADQEIPYGSLHGARFRRPVR
ncbi:MAG: hypothetical protein ABIF77_12405 [bacterium]